MDFPINFLSAFLLVNQPHTYNPLSPLQGPHGAVDKPFLWAEGRVSLKAALNKSIYRHGEQVSATVDIHNESRKIVRKIRVNSITILYDRQVKITSGSGTRKTL